MMGTFYAEMVTDEKEYMIRNFIKKLFPYLNAVELLRNLIF